ncbi:MAG: glycogen/starch/alpha-glucan phosphorylase [Nitrospirae bacterium]|nr:glycogen/starch/alpha-glucan phosphorylase [Nitrospirota bacterium]
MKKEGHISEKTTTDVAVCGSLKDDIQRHIVSILGNDYRTPRKDTFYNGLAYCVRDRLIERWLNSQRSYYKSGAKRVYYLSMEFLPGRFLKNYILNLSLEKECREALEGTDFSLADLETEENDPGLGNGGLGRLASCFLDSLASLNIPSYGYGIRYDYGIFFQKIVNGWQVELCDNWFRKGNPWEIDRRGFLYTVKFYGRSDRYLDEAGNMRCQWADADTVDAMACDILIPGYGTDIVNNMRLWAAISSFEFNMEFYNHGDYMKAMEVKMLRENITKVLYPSDEMEQGRMLRLKQQYFFVAATFQDIFRRFRKRETPFSKLPEMIAVQLNDTHPAISIAELMRLLLDEERLCWEEAWDICVRTFAYTNHTVLPEALEKWPVEMIGKLLPRHLEIIYEINHRFLQEVEQRYPSDLDRLARMSLIEEGPQKKVRMAHLAIVGSHSVNGVAELHTRILKTSLFRDFDEFFPGRIRNVTNGITQRRWLLQANPGLSALITSQIGNGWITDLYDLKKLIPLAEDPLFRAAWREVKRSNKALLGQYILRKTGIVVDEESLYDMQIKRIHEYKRQLLNILHVITLYNRLKHDPQTDMVPRTVIFSGKAAPGYFFAKLIIKLVNDIARTVNSDAEVSRKLKVVFLPNYCISQAEKVIPAADLSEQISTAGMEASGTSNMKLALNGALTIGTLDGANIEIMEEVGQENMFIFGMKIDEVSSMRVNGYNPWDYYHNDADLRKALDMIGWGFFSSEKKDLYMPIFNALLHGGDRYLILADYRSYVQAQDAAGAAYRNAEDWSRRSILNTANMGKFSSDRAVMEYADNIWGLNKR